MNCTPKWARTSAHKKVFGLPRPWVGKIALRPVAANGPRWRSLLRGDAVSFIFPAPSFTPAGHSTASQIRFRTAGRGRDSDPSAIRAHSGQQAAMWGLLALGGVALGRDVKMLTVPADRMRRQGKHPARAAAERPGISHQAISAPG